MKLRTTALTLLIILLCTSCVLAAPQPVIKADSTVFDLASGQYILRGNVLVKTGGRTITAGEARVSVWSMEVWAGGGITLCQDDLSFSGNSVYVNGRNSTAQVNGEITFKRNDLAITADAAQYNWRTRQGLFSGAVAVRQGDNRWATDSLAYNVETNAFQ